LTLAEFLDELPSYGERDIPVKATSSQPARTARVTLRWGEVLLPPPKVLTPWLCEHRPKEPLCLSVVELREMSPPPDCQPLRWVLYATEPVCDAASADRVIADYEKRPTIEDYHKCYKTGCHVEQRQYETAERLDVADADRRPRNARRPRRNGRTASVGEHAPRGTQDSGDAYADDPRLRPSTGRPGRPPAAKMRRRTRLDHPLARLRKTPTHAPRRRGPGKKMWVILSLERPSYT
jgi:hypothetical protein